MKHRSKGCIMDSEITVCSLHSLLTKNEATLGPANIKSNSSQTEQSDNLQDKPSRNGGFKRLCPRASSKDHSLIGLNHKLFGSNNYLAVLETDISWPK